MKGVSPAIPPVCAIVGPDRAQRLEALEELLRPVLKDPHFAGAKRVDGAEAELADVLDEVRTPSLLGDLRVVVIEEAGEFITSHRKALERYCEDPAPTGSLILLCSSLPSNQNIYKYIRAKGRVVPCEQVKPYQIRGWIEQRVRGKYGKRMAPRAAELLREFTGDSLGLLDAELRKLVDYVGQRDEITTDDVEALTGRQREEKVFAITDAMSVGDTATALGQWQQVLATDRAAEGRSIAGLAWAVRTLLRARRDWEKGASLEALAKRHYTNAETMRRRLEGVSYKQLERQQQALLEADLAVKTGASTVPLAVEKFIVEHSSR